LKYLDIGIADRVPISGLGGENHE